MLGSIKGERGIYRSEDFGETWTSYTNTGLPMPLVKLVAGDASTFGKVYIGSDGRGVSKF